MGAAAKTACPALRNSPKLPLDRRVQVQGAAQAT